MGSELWAASVWKEASTALNWEPQNHALKYPEPPLRGCVAIVVRGYLGGPRGAPMVQSLHSLARGAQHACA